MVLIVVNLDIKGLSDAQIVSKAVKHFTPMYLGGIRLCVANNGQSVIALRLDGNQNQTTDPIADYDRAMAIVGRR